MIKEIEKTLERIKENVIGGWYVCFSSSTLEELLNPLIEKAIGYSSKKNGSVLDLFLGSGSTLIAAEKLNRKCYGMELDEKYCDVIIERWEQFTGQKAIKNGTK